MDKRFEGWEEKAKDTFEGFTSEGYSEEKLHKVLDNEAKIEDIFKNKYLSDFIDDVKLFFAMLKDYFTKKYPELPVRSVVMMVLTLLYVLSPVDLIPDFIPVIGYLDDAFMFGLCLKACADDVEDYKKWKAMQSESVEQ